MLSSPVRGLLSRAVPLLLAAVLAAARPTVAAAALAPCASSQGEAVQGEGPPVPAGPTVLGIEFEGLQSIPEASLLSILGQAVGAPLDRPTLERGIKTVWATYHARVSVLYREAEQGGVQGLELLVQVQELPRDLEARFVGNKAFDHDKLLEFTGIYEGEPVYLDDAPRVRARLERAYRSEGYYFVEVEAVVRQGGVDPDTGEVVAPDMIFEIREGPKVKVRAIEIHGNDKLPNRRILGLFKRGLFKLARTELHGPWLFNWFAKKFVEEDLEADILAMRQVYRDLGYLDAVVGVERLEFSDDRRWVTIHLTADEGPRFEVASIRIEAVEPYQDPSRPGEWLYRPTELAIPEEELLDLIELEPGAPFETAAVRRDGGALLKRFGKDGYLAHTSLPVPERWEFRMPDEFGTAPYVVDPDGSRVHVTYQIAQGHQIFIREVRTRGNLHTQDRVIRQYITVDPGELADPGEIEDSRRRIQGTSYFSDDRNVLEHRDPYYVFEDTGDPAWKDLVYVVEEGSVLSFNISGGVSSNLGAFGLISYSQRNFDISRLPSSPLTLISDIAERRAFHGAGQELRIEASPGTQVSYFNVLFREPDLFGLYRDRIGLTLRARRTFRVYRPYDEERQELGFEFSRQVGPDAAGYVGYRYGDVTVDDIDRDGEPNLGDPLSVPRLLKDQEGVSNLAALEFGFRYSTTDNRLDPRNGLRFTLANDLELEAVGSDFNFIKTEVNFDVFDEIGQEDELKVNDRWHFQLDAGVATPFGDTDNVPYTERFFLGGQSRLRGFAFRGVGPNDKGDPIGGATYLFTSLEYRRPLITATQPGTYREVETIHWGLFLDAGVLGIEEFDFDPKDTRVSAGVLLGLSVPLPISFSIGIPLRDGTDDREQRIGFAIGFGF